MDRKLKKYVAIDFGTSATRVYIQGLGVVFNEPTIYAWDIKTRKIIAAGLDAKRMIGKHNSSIKIERPIVGGVVASIETLKIFFAEILKKYEDKLQDSIICIACSLSVTSLERKALIDFARHLGAYYVQVVDDVLLAGLGAGINVNEPEGVLVLDIGAGKATAATIASGDVVSYKWTRTAGAVMDQEIIKFIRTKHNLAIADSFGEQLKIKIGTLVKSKMPLKEKILGIEVLSGLPKEIYLTDTELTKILQLSYNNITSLITQLLEETPSELTIDILRNGITVTGGMGKLNGTKDFLEEYFEIPVKIAKNCLTTVIDGAIAYEKQVRKELERKIEDKENLRSF
ncbi:rod shape-determining protein [Spiroplasma endosymbiont of Labia minor]|uniref:rod shape-determining protein n=1 Tax=Spiroplasma endosymbiont of Labia minor TaxID=3066305 RepID=UPI0030D4FF8E